MAIDGNGLDGYGSAGFTQEEIEDFVGDMVTGNTETGITVTYQDGDGTIDFVVANTDFAADSGSVGITPGDTLTIAGGSNVSTSISGDTLTITVTDTGITDVVDDTTPQLGGNLDVNGNSIVSTSNGDINITPNGTGNVALGNFTFNADQTVGAGQDNYALIYDNASGLIGLESVAAGGAGDAWGDPVDDDIIPDADSTRDLGAPSAYFALAYIDDIFLSNNLSMANTKSIIDTSGNEQLLFNPTGSAVNYWDLRNSATGNAPALHVEGDDTNISLDLQPKGTGNIILGNYTLDGDQSVGAGQDNYVLTYDDSSGLISLEAAAAGGISDVVDDTTPQLGGQLDVNGNAIGDGTRELLTFTEDASAVNHVNIENESTGSGPIISAAGDDTNIDLIIDGKGSGDVVLSSSNLDVTGNIVVSGTVDGRDVATDGTKLDGIEASADVTDEANVTAALDGATLTAVTVAGTDKVLVQDASDTDNLKTVTAQSVADLTTADAWSDQVDSDIIPDTDSTYDLGDSAHYFANSYIDSMTSPTIVGPSDSVEIHDSSGNIQLKTSNYLTTSGDYVEIMASLSGFGPRITAQGSGSNVDLTLAPKGTGEVTIVGGKLDLNSSTGQLNFNTTTVLSIAAGTVTLGNIDAIDATTEATFAGEFLQNDGDTGTGVYDFGGATSFEIPNGAAPTVNAAGEIAVDTSITDYTGMIKYYDGTEELTVLAVPTANLSTTDGEVVAYNATNNELEFVTAGGSQDWELISTATASNDATIEFTGLSSTYCAYKIIITSCKPVSDNVGFFLRTSTDNGSTWDSTSGDYYWHNTYLVGGVYSDNNEAAGGALGGSTNIGLIAANNTYRPGNGTGEFLNGEVTLYDTSAANYTYTQWDISYLEEGNTWAGRSLGAGIRKSSADVDAIQFRFESGNVSVGNFYLFGLRAS